MVAMVAAAVMARLTANMPGKMIATKSVVTLVFVINRIPYILPFNFVICIIPALPIQIYT
jgi:hypothetical protein